MILGDIQGFEIIIVRLYFGSLGYVETQPGENPANFIGNPGDRMQGAPIEGAARQGDIQLIEGCSLQRGDALQSLGGRCFDGLFCKVGLFAGCGPFLRRELGDVA